MGWSVDSKLTSSRFEALVLHQQFGDSWGFAECEWVNSAQRGQRLDSSQ